MKLLETEQYPPFFLISPKRLWHHALWHHALCTRHHAL